MPSYRSSHDQFWTRVRAEAAARKRAFHTKKYWPLKCFTCGAERQPDIQSCPLCGDARAIGPDLQTKGVGA